MTKPILARFPEELVKEIDEQVEKNLYSSRTDFLKCASRNLIKETELGYGALRDFKPWKGKSAVQIAREMRSIMWNELLERAGGDEDKAIDLLFKDLKKIKMP